MNDFFPGTSSTSQAPAVYLKDGRTEETLASYSPSGRIDNEAPSRGTVLEEAVRGQGL